MLELDERRRLSAAALEDLLVPVCASGSVEPSSLELGFVAGMI